MKIKSLANLFFIFVKVGAILLGGGYVILPILMSEIVEKRALITEEELVDYFALSQSLPGIIAANISMFVGYKLLGKSGAFVAMLGIIFIPFLLIAIFATFLDYVVKNPYIGSVLWGVGVAVIALILLTLREIWQKTKKDYYFYVIFLSALISLLWFDFSPIKTIFVFVFCGVFYKSLVTPKGAR